MELTAVIKGLEALTKKSEVEVVSDSSYVVKGMNEWVFNWIKKGWKTPDGKFRKNTDLWKSLVELAKGHNVKWTWVRGHAGHPLNERADQLAVNATPARKTN
jgi:ribonuclease HI